MSYLWNLCSAYGCYLVLGYFGPEQVPNWESTYLKFYVIMDVGQSKMVWLIDHMNELFLFQLFLKRTVLSAFLLLYSSLLFLQGLYLLNLQTLIDIITRQKTDFHSQLSNDKNKTLFLQNFELKFHHFIR
jgi:hypothetical protein